MNKTSAAITAALCVIGFVSGYAVNRQFIVGHNQVDEIVTGLQKKRSVSPRAGAFGFSASETNDRLVLTSKVRSTDTLQTMINKGESASYGEMALWLLDASGEDIAAYWDFRKAGKIDGDKSRLIFMNWTRVDPLGAINATAGTDAELLAWWAWPASDPEAALAAVGGKMLHRVAKGIGEFQPQWLLEHYEEIPEYARNSALEGLMTWKENDDPLGTLKFLKGQGRGIDMGTFRTLARKDPWSAFDWLEKNNQLSFSSSSGGGSEPIGELLEIMKTEHPEDLERLAAMTTPGRLKWKIEDMLFSNLLSEDPEAALAAAKATETPLIRSKRMAEIGQSLLESDPEKAFQIAGEMFLGDISKLSADMVIQHEHSSSSWGEGLKGPEIFLNSLLEKDPVRTLDQTLSVDETGGGAFMNLASTWSRNDLVAYTQWLNNQENQQIRDKGSIHVVSQLAQKGHYHEAAEWAMSASTNNGGLYSLLYQWNRNDPAEAAAWLETAPIPDSRKKDLKRFTDEHNKN